MLVAHAAHDAIVAGPVAAGLLAVVLLTWRSSRRARREGRARMREEPPDQPTARSIRSSSSSVGS